MNRKRESNRESLSTAVIVIPKSLTVNDLTAAEPGKMIWQNGSRSFDWLVLLFRLHQLLPHIATPTTSEVTLKVR